MSIKCMYIYLYLYASFHKGCFSFLIQGRRELQESLCRITTGGKAPSSRWRPSRLHSFILGRAHLHQLSSGLHHSISFLFRLNPQSRCKIPRNAAVTF